MDNTLSTYIITNSCAQPVFASSIFGKCDAPSVEPCPPTPSKLREPKLFTAASTTPHSAFPTPHSAFPTPHSAYGSTITFINPASPSYKRWNQLAPSSSGTVAVMMASRSKAPLAISDRHSGYSPLEPHEP